MVKFPEAVARLHHNVFVCKKCKAKMRTQMARILQKSVACRKCGSKVFRPIKSKQTK
ncbi:hypothetical protein J4409_02310 [Candidatus Woesearchaeota archaeon]|nr:hypothetical protein [Candidatus Woesearchaeota archaeon]